MTDNQNNVSDVLLDLKKNFLDDKKDLQEN